MFTCMAEAKAHSIQSEDDDVSLCSCGKGSQEENNGQVSLCAICFFFLQRLRLTAGFHRYLTPAPPTR